MSYVSIANQIVEVKGRSDETMLAKLEVCRSAVESQTNYSYLLIYGDQIWNKYYDDLVKSGYNIDDSLALLHENNNAKKSDSSIPYIDWVIHDKLILPKEVKS